ncbi:MAG: hypothetical protein COB76_04085 [Alphaproteobacteria bacterium]|nr:MAG: hypothetical protein COB76_04085 [Alphaproteobacteria bacterium]
MREEFNGRAFFRDIKDRKESILGLYKDAKYFRNQFFLGELVIKQIAVTIDKFVDEGLICRDELYSFLNREWSEKDKGEGMNFLWVEAVCNHRTENVIELLLARTKKAKNIVEANHGYYPPLAKNSRLSEGFLNHRRFMVS